MKILNQGPLPDRLASGGWLEANAVHQGDATDLIYQVEPESLALSVWSPPYHVGKNYESEQSLDDWEKMLRTVIAGHFQALKPGGFCAINIADILCFQDETMPRIQAETFSSRRLKVTREDVLAAIAEVGTTERNKVAAHLGVSEQTVDRRLNGNNIRGGKYNTQTRVKTVAGMIEEMGLDAGLFMYDRRIWVKDPAWANSRWHTSSLRAIDEFEYIFVLWKPGITRVVRDRLSPHEWTAWGSRAVWNMASVRANDDHEAKFPPELPTRLIRLLSCPGDIVLDPFSGSGTTLAAAVRTGRHAMGFELDPTYAKASAKALKQSQNEPVQDSLPL
jgi:DNA modification methylase